MRLIYFLCSIVLLCLMSCNSSKESVDKTKTKEKVGTIENNKATGDNAPSRPIRDLQSPQLLDEVTNIANQLSLEGDELETFKALNIKYGEQVQGVMKGEMSRAKMERVLSLFKAHDINVKALLPDAGLFPHYQQLMRQHRQQVFGFGG